MSVPAKIKAAFDHVQSIFPEVVMVLYTPTQRWCYMDEDGNCPAFENKVDVDILEAGADAVDCLPCVFYFPHAEEDKAAGDSPADGLTLDGVFESTVLVNLVDVQFSGSRSPEGLTQAGNLWSVVSLADGPSGKNLVLKCRATGLTECVRKENIGNFALAREAIKAGDQFVNTARISVKGRIAAVGIGYRWTLVDNDGYGLLKMECPELNVSSWMDISSIVDDFVRFEG